MKSRMTRFNFFDSVQGRFAYAVARQSEVVGCCVPSGGTPFGSSFMFSVGGNKQDIS